MTTIIYKFILGRYLITDIIQNEADEICIKFDTPIDAKLIICDTVVKVECGVARIKAERLKDGRIAPMLYLKNTVSTMEEFILSRGAVIKSRLDEKAIRELEEVTDGILKRLNAIEKSLNEAWDKITQEIKF